ncbi:CotY/CotZ family spore coat protein [Bacillus sp. 3103sda1]|uniref:CotY/CotZ family spore coat protein n=1 Tax=Bacillus sp. 3103sda1 TaxID=2953808 RepID=UPI0020A03503|nr:CotY/CotZ family spore coat protein [Bacillus sp. 3103sda1]MCP1122892.1 CotY/CotZ family spore coat protein [Bacillus sp. 3103sda1]
MGNNDDKKVINVNCVCDVVNFINELQDCATSTCPTGCDVPFLGAHQGSRLANTRPFVLFNSGGEPFKVFVGSGSIKKCYSYIYRVESVDDCTAVLRALEVHSQDQKDCEEPVCAFLNNPNATLQATNSVVTVDLNCFCAIQCLRDAHVSGV